ncbi:transposase [Tychonema sp. LEGE 07199]|nr:transposase [Tychonema sp. LEGE 07199]MBE9134215.1 transposase [Tychonema sp. LEGE 07196]
MYVYRIYRTQSNRAWCKEIGIRMSGVPLEIPLKISASQRRSKLSLMKEFVI